MNTKYTSINEIIEANQKAGGYFFSPNTMRAFKTRVNPEIFGGTVFIISNKQTGKPRVYRVCEITPKGNINYITEKDVTSLYRARKIAAAYVMGKKVYKVGYRDEEGKRSSLVVYRYGRKVSHYWNMTAASSARLEKLFDLKHIQQESIGTYPQ